MLSLSCLDKVKQPRELASVESHSSSHSDRELDGMSYAEEVLVTKSELEEKKQRMSELETQASLYVHVSVSC